MRIKRIVVAILAGLLAQSTIAQTTAWPSEEAIKRTLESHPFPSPERLGTQPVPLPPRVSAPPAGVDIEAIARARLKLPNVDQAATHASMPLRVFITLDMPKASLERITEQATHTGAVLVLRGLKSNSMRETIATVAGLIGNRNVAWVIDPEAFTRWGVHRAPSFVLMLDEARGPDPGGCTGACVSPSAFVSIAGDVSLDYALKAMMRQKPELKPRIERLLERLR